MVPPESILLFGTNAQEVFRAYNQAMAQLSPDVRQQLAAVMKKYLATFDPDEICERLNGRTVAQVLAEIPPDELQSLVRTRFAWQEVWTCALTGQATTVEMLSCPKCGGALSIRFDPASPQPDGTTAGFLIIRCMKCSSGSCADELNDTPPWVESLGPEIQTRPVKG